MKFGIFERTIQKEKISAGNVGFIWKEKLYIGKPMKYCVQSFRDQDIHSPKTKRRNSKVN
jgi:hypothetical protein